MEVDKETTHGLSIGFMTFDLLVSHRIFASIWNTMRGTILDTMEV